MSTFNTIWNEAQDLMRTTLQATDRSVVYDEFFSNLELAELNGNEAVVLTKYQFHAQFLKDNENLNLINSCLAQVIGRDVRCRIIWENDYNTQKELSNNINNIYNHQLNDNVMPEFSFENFVHGPSNKEAYSAALAVATNPGRNIYNPLFIYGDSGLGKTHLLCAIGNYIKAKYPEKKILYISSSGFVNEVYQASKRQNIDMLKNQLNSLDVLLMDDIQTLSGKKASNDVFFDIYNELFNNRKQIILSSDRPPGQIKDIEERLISRFNQGLSVTVTTPEFDTALQILKMKIKTHGINENNIDPEVLSFLATHFASDVRSLEGSLNRLLFYSINFSESSRIDLEMATNAFKGQIATVAKSTSDLQIKDIINCVADYYGLTRQQIIGKARTKNISNARHITMYLCRKKLDVSYLKIGEELGGRDHATVISAYEKISKLVNTDDSYKRVINEIEKNLLTN